jgi:hypothetical protein
MLVPFDPDLQLATLERRRLASKIRGLLAQPEKLLVSEIGLLPPSTLLRVKI